MWSERSFSIVLSFKFPVLIPLQLFVPLQLFSFSLVIISMKKAGNSNLCILIIIPMLLPFITKLHIMSWFVTKVSQQNRLFHNTVLIWYCGLNWGHHQGLHCSLSAGRSSFWSLAQKGAVVVRSIAPGRGSEEVYAPLCLMFRVWTSLQAINIKHWIAKIQFISRLKLHFFFPQVFLFTYSSDMFQFLREEGSTL